MKTSLTLGSVLITSLLLTACGPTEEDTQEAPIDITNWDFSEDQVLEDVTDEEGAVDYYTTGELDVSATLTVKPGVIIAFGKDAGLNVSGALKVEGESMDEVVFEERDSGQGWIGVSLPSSTPHTLNYLTIEDAGNASFLNDPLSASLLIGRDSNPTSAATLNNVQVVDSKGVGIFAGKTSVFSASAVSVKGSAAHAFELETIDQLAMLGTDTIATDNQSDVIQLTEYTPSAKAITIDLPDVPVHVMESLIVEGDDASLTIKAGTEMYFDTDTYLSVSAPLNITGSAEQPVVLGAISGMSGGWAGLWLVDQDSHTIDHAVIENGGGSELEFIGAAANIVVGTGVQLFGTLNMTNSTVKGSAGYGVYLKNVESDGDVSISDVTYEANALGDVGSDE